MRADRWRAAAPTFTAALQDNPVCIVDVGCAGGIDPTWAAIDAPGMLRFVGFEASPEQFHVLPPEPRARYLNTAISDTVGELDFFARSTVGSLQRRHERERQGETFDRIRVPATTLARLRVDGVVPSLDVLKIDVEGHELPVLRGAGQHIADETFAIKLEFSFAGADGFAALHTFLRERDFALFGLSYAQNLLGEIYGGDALYLRGLDSLVAGPNARGRVRKALAHAIWLRQHDYARLGAARAKELGVLSGVEVDEIVAIADARVFLPDILPALSLAGSHVLFALAQLAAGRSHRTKAAPKGNRLVRSPRLYVSTAMGWLWRRQAERSAMLAERLRKSRGE